MQVKGRVRSGLGEGAYFMTRDVYLEPFREILGSDPFPGTLNIEIDDPMITEKILKGARRIRGGHGFGDVLYVKALLNDDVEGALVFPLKTRHSPSCLEFIAPVPLRKTLKLRDGDTVTLKIIN
ncbi:DUF120 domain-containing protein [Methanothermobacter wolfeii]|uniref:DUF120 domain-containing protein n=1 Tax=Methanothermobacter wolfeii TaxID=145261 RepID=UPI0024B33C30|nr:DUF120 domain-containing protein [Methanothermobacter wolfeii]MDI6701799.1 DUF120 domain-containing protein [Methanothermobacter wolfeii]